MCQYEVALAWREWVVRVCHGEPDDGTDVHKAEKRGVCVIVCVVCVHANDRKAQHFRTRIGVRISQSPEYTCRLRV
jgi:hypothetical protein